MNSIVKNIIIDGNTYIRCEFFGFISWVTYDGKTHQLIEADLRDKLEKKYQRIQKLERIWKQNTE